MKLKLPKMSVGTKSVLFGVHCFLLHPWFVAAAWWKLYGFPWDPHMWLAFFVHDLGYWGKPNMDGPEGECHVLWGANLMFKLFGAKWWCFCAYHSRFWAKKCAAMPSRLCFADKLATVITPAWLYLPMARWSGEIHEYMTAWQEAQKRNIQLHLVDTVAQAKHVHICLANTPKDNQKVWFAEVQAYMRKWVAEHIDGREDTWTSRHGEM